MITIVIESCVPVYSSLHSPIEHIAVNTPRSESNVVVLNITSTDQALKFLVFFEHANSVYKRTIQRQGPTTVGLPYGSAISNGIY